VFTLRGNACPLTRNKPQAAFVALDHGVDQARSIGAARKNNFYKFQGVRVGAAKLCAAGAISSSK
jgi:hypothetical protein